MLNSNVALHLLGFILIINIHAQVARDTGPVGQITIFSIVPCDPDINEIKLSMQLSIDDDGFRSLDIDLEPSFDIDEDVFVNIIADKWVDDEWEKEKFVTSGSLLGLVNKHMPKLWENVRNQMEPKIENSDIIEVGTYSAKGFKDVSENVDLPSILYGRFRFYFYFTKDDVEFACLTGEAESWE